MEENSGDEACTWAKSARKPKQPRKTATIAQPRVKAPPVTDFQSHAREVVCDNFADIMQTMAEKSAAGSLPHTKYLFEIGGVKDDIERNGDAEGGPSLADMLLAEVRKHRHTEPHGSTDAPAEADRTLERGADWAAKAQ